MPAKLTLLAAAALAAVQLVDEADEVGVVGPAHWTLAIHF